MPSENLTQLHYLDGSSGARGSVSHCWNYLLSSRGFSTEVRFAAKSLEDQSDQLILSTEVGNLPLPVQAVGVLPPTLK